MDKSKPAAMSELTCVVKQAFATIAVRPPRLNTTIHSCREKIRLIAATAVTTAVTAAVTTAITVRGVVGAGIAGSVGCSIRAVLRRVRFAAAEEAETGNKVRSRGVIP